VNFCPHCGAKSGAVPGAPAPSPQLVKKADTSGTIISVIIFIILMGWGGWQCSGSSLGNMFQNAADIKAKVSMGMTQAEVKAALGDPEHVQDMDSGVGEYKVDMDCWYYKGGQVQVCFDNGRVMSVNTY
jgi:hypothetical protein